MDKKKIVALFSALLFNCIMGAVISSMLGYGAIGGAAVACLLAIALGGFMPKGAAYSGVLTEVWTGELVKTLRGHLDASWLVGVPDQSSIVNNDTIHMVDVGVDPDVLINNNTYPLTLQTLSDGDLTFPLYKFQTKPVAVTDDELYALSYDKMARVKESCANAINDKKYYQAAFEICPGSGEKVLKTTGKLDTNTKRVKMTLEDVIAMKRSMDKLGVPAGNRRLVLCPDHVNDLLESEQAFREQYNINRADGTIGKLYGFEIYESSYNPIYGPTHVKYSLTTKGYEAGSFQASFAFYVPRIFKATGSTKMYYSSAETDPQNQQNTIAFRHYFICMPKKMDAAVVMLSEYKAS